VSDALLFGAMVLAFALGVTAHIAIVVGLASRSPRWRALAALLVAPLAPYWAFRERMSLRGGIWIFSVLAYGVARLLARA
jgi:hypothetical protein